MRIDAYLDATGTTAAALAAAVGISGPSITRIKRGEQNVSLDLAIKIVAATGGKVTLEDLSMTRQQAAA